MALLLSIGFRRFYLGAATFAALAQVIGPVIWPQPYVAWTGAAAVLWNVAFAAFVIRYAPIVVAPRADGG